MRNTEPSGETKALGARITAARAEKGGMSVAKLAELAGVSKAYMHQIENGDCARPSAQVLFGIAQVLDTSIAHLLGKGPSGPEPGTVQIPASLQEYAKSHPDLRQEDIEMLARIKFRDKQPTEPKDWDYLWESIKRSVK
jgi:transcriptional regulator with XRE-family HTH domain